MRPELLPILGRALAVLGVLLLVGMVLRLVVAVLQPVLPLFLMAGLADGWATLLGIVAPAVGPIMALVILAAVCWVIVGKRR
jgi:hypothetical protein